MIKYKGFLLSLFYYAISAFGASLTIKAAVGVSAFTAMNVALSNASTIKVGTITTIMNLVFLIAYIAVTKFKYPIKYILQGFFVMLFGILINIFVYQVLDPISITKYWERIILLSVGTVIGGLAIGKVIYYNVITFPIENLCMELEQITGKKFLLFRYGVDGLSLTVSIVVSLMFGLPFYIREGTVINVLLLTGTMNITKQKDKKITEAQV